MISARAPPSRCPPSASIASVHTVFATVAIAVRLGLPADRELAAHRFVAADADVGEELSRAAGGIGPDQDRGAVPVMVGQQRALLPGR